MQHFSARNNIYGLRLPAYLYIAILVFFPSGITDGSSSLTENRNSFEFGYFNDTFLSNESVELGLDRNLTSSWTQLNIIGPSPRIDSTMVYCKNDVAVLFGGFFSDRNGTYFHYNDTWIFDFGTKAWTNRTPAHSPLGRNEQTMVYDEKDDVVILFGGSDGEKRMNDIWAYNIGTNKWTELVPSFSPAPRSYSSIAYDSRNDLIVLFGGNMPDNSESNETWTYDYSTNTWTNKTPSVSPPSREEMSMAYDMDNGIIVMFGGYSQKSGATLQNDTWAYNVSTNVWTNISTAASPPPTADIPMVYDAENRIMMLPDATSRTNYTFWDYDHSSNSWKGRTTSNAPSPRAMYEVAFSTQNGELILFGGINIDFKGDTWIYGVKKYQSSGRFTSKPFDTGGSAFFGTFQWSASTSDNTSITFQTRTSNGSEEMNGKSFIGPDGSPNSYYLVSNLAISKINDRTRWIQFRAYLNSTNNEETPVLRSVTIQYNLLQSIQFDSPKGGENWTGIHKLKWIAADPDNDTLKFDIFLENETQSTSLAFNLTGVSTWSWDTSAVPSGQYHISIIAKDDNPTIPLRVEAHSKDFIIFHPINPPISDVELTVEGFPWLFIILILLALAADVGLYFGEKRNVK